MQRIFGTLIATLLTLAVSTVCGEDRPNVVIFHCHDLGQYLHCYGVGTARTPNFDSPVNPCGRHLPDRGGYVAHVATPGLRYRPDFRP